MSPAPRSAPKRDGEDGGRDGFPAQATRKWEETASTKKKGATNGEDNSLRSDAKKNLPLEGGGGRSPSPASSSTPKNCGSGDGGRPAESRRSGERDCAHDESRRRPQAQRTLSWKGEGRRHPAAAMTTTLETTVRWLARRRPRAAK